MRRKLRRLLGGSHRSAARSPLRWPGGSLSNDLAWNVKAGTGLLASSNIPGGTGVCMSLREGQQPLAPSQGASLRQRLSLLRQSLVPLLRVGVVLVLVQDADGKPSGQRCNAIRHKGYDESRVVAAKFQDVAEVKGWKRS